MELSARLPRRRLHRRRQAPHPYAPRRASKAKARRIPHHRHARADRPQRSHWRGSAALAETRDRDRAAEAPPPASPSLDVARGPNPEARSLYPGSLMLRRKHMRAQDRLSAIELHQVEPSSFSALFAFDMLVRVTHVDAWLAPGA